ncbi:hypothetical protein BOTBODRAFT_113556, partial [Botryobasidium botryosum FD-172 SS1]
GVLGLFHNPYALTCAALASLGGLMFGYDQGVIANVLVMPDFMDRFPMGAFEQGALTAVLEFGALFGALTAGMFADGISRQRAICIGCAMFSVGSLLQCVASSIFTLFIGRALGGIGIGSLSMLSPLYMSEISPPEVRGSLLSIEQFSIVLGVVAGFWLGFWTRDFPGSACWRVPLGVQLIPGLVLGFTSLLLPPSPRLLALHGRDQEALESLAKLRMRVGMEDDPLLQLEYTEMKLEVLLIRRNEPTGPSVHSKSTWRAKVVSWSYLFTPAYRAQTLIGVLVMFFQQWSGINALLYYGPSIMASMGLEGDTILLIGSGFINIVQFLFVVPAIMLIDRWGTRPLLMVGAVVMGASHGLIAILVWKGQSDWHAHQTEAWIAVGLVYLFTAAYGMSFGPVAWVLPSEIFPLSVRSRGVALSTASNWLNNFIIGLITPTMIAASAVGTYFVFAAACVAAFFWAKYLVPETKGRSLEEMDDVFRSSVGHEHALLKQQVRWEIRGHKGCAICANRSLLPQLEEEIGLRGKVDTLINWDPSE